MKIEGNCYNRGNLAWGCNSPPNHLEDMQMMRTNSIRPAKYYSAVNHNDEEIYEDE